MLLIVCMWHVIALNYSLNRHMVYLLPVDSCLMFVAFLELEIQSASLLTAPTNTKSMRVLLNLGYISSRGLV